MSEPGEQSPEGIAEVPEAANRTTAVRTSGRDKAVVAGTVAFLVLCGCFIFWRAQRTGLVVTAQPKPLRDGSGLTVAGDVSIKGKQETGATVWATVENEMGQSYRLGSVTTDENGQFDLGRIPNFGPKAEEGEPLSVTVRALKKGTSRVKSTTFSLGQGRRRRTEGFPWRPLQLILVAVIVTVSFMAFAPERGSSLLHFQYWMSLVLTVLIASIPIIYISLGKGHLEEVHGELDVVSIKGAVLFRGSYVEQVPAEWLVSFTSPVEHASKGGPRPVQQGFGAPLWTLQWASIGAILYALLDILAVFRNNKGPENPESVRAHVVTLLEHQFYILCAPLGALVLYQVLVGIGAGAKNFTVALVVVAAGFAIGPILARAKDELLKYFGRIRNSSDSGAPPRG